MSSKQKRDDPEQSKRFEETAREKGADEISDDAFEEAIRRIAPKPLPPRRPSSSEK